MQSPLRSERDAFRMVLLAVVYFGLIAIGWKIDRWLGVAVFVALTSAGVAWLLRRRRHGAGSRPARPRSRSGELRVVVVAGEGVAVPELVDIVRRRAAGRRAVLQVVGSAGGDDLAERLVELRAAGLDATGETADGDPLTAVEEAVRRFGPDEIVVAPGAAGAGAWLEPAFVDRARSRFDLPVVALAAERERPA